VLPSYEVPVVTKELEDPAREFDEFFTTNYARLARLFRRVAGDPGQAEELAAEAFWRLHRKPPASDRNLIGWLYRTGLRLALDNLKKQKRRAHYEALGPVLSPARGPEETLERRERRDRVRQVLAALKADHAALLLLRSDGFSLSELAAILNLNPGSVGTFLARAEIAFRKEYVKRYGEP
jgi:RNA polymerase sigma-70 factor, ECF subfamily